MTTGTRFRVLGLLEVDHDGCRIPISAGKHRALLATLLLRANRTVTVAELTERIWRAAPPADPKGTIQKYVMRLRQVVPDSRIRTEPDGYRIEVTGDQLDLLRFQELIFAADRAAVVGDSTTEAALLRDALALWRQTPPLPDVPSEWVQQAEVPRLTELYLQAVERRIELDLAANRHKDVVAELAALVQDYPLRERFWSQRLRALFGAGRQGEALTAYREVVALLAGELGIAPGAELRAVHQQILRGTAEGGTRDVPRNPPDSASAGHRPQHHLPMSITGFVGRRTEVEQVVNALSAPGSGGLPELVVITGPAGAGKTTLAVHAAHQVAHLFPDGQLYVDMRAHADAVALSESEVLGHFLRSLGVTPDEQALTLDDQIATYRTLLAGRRILVVLDNVADATQVRPLLPGSPGCAVIVTSRHELTGLAVVPGGRFLSLGMLSPTEGHQLLASMLGERRVSAEPDAVRALVDACGGLALAVRLAGAHLLLHSDLGIGDYVEQLTAASPVQKLQVDGDEQANLAAAFDWSYRRLSPPQRRMLRLLSLVPGPDITPLSAAALMDISGSMASEYLEQLAAASLLTRRGAGRFGVHDLVRAYAADRCRDEELVRELHQAKLRLITCYIAAADAASTRFLPLTRLSRAALDPPPVAGEATMDDLDDNHASMVAAVRESADGDHPELTYHLADALRAYFMVRGHTVDWLTVVEIGLGAARRDRADEAIAAMLNSKGALRYHTGDTQQAEDCFRGALTIYERLESPVVHDVRVNLGIIAGVSGDPRLGVEYLTSALAGYRETGDVTVEHRTRENLVLALLQSGELEQAGRECVVLGGVGSRPDRYRALGMAGLVAQHTADLRAAARLLTEAAEASAAHGDHRTEICLRTAVAACQLEMGQVDQAMRLASTSLEWAQRDDRRSVASAETIRAGALRRAGRIAESRAGYVRALREARQARHRDQECEALIGWAELELEVHRLDDATAKAHEAVRHARRPRRPLRLTHALAVLAACHRRDGELGQAREAVDEALRTARACRYRLGEARALAELGEVEWAEGNRADAVRSWRLAETLYTQISSDRGRTMGRRIDELTDQDPAR
ncbi:DNA-binding transcriptional activator of the SARP family [Amycolatopsis arida]|uniref:DNA-binding transcriptional activator of the SARP family n=1 Tax=Amycolatopsis arida TaxID=587909 RepID=A0A1I6ACU1_9PSEU|nr:BTAD domain-containing putative transcriptional regulator [Amycolatopsis arida]TDX97632.1 DNA-binding SARP family transcriptional activator [Amycolatopsis arida]SFQ66452.1 DNA-binding transcriptional activator of the SARP family [Amycolatopsis arida]